jgi:outer membrane protein OmpA-like peptidoglycan-associated protein
MKLKTLFKKQEESEDQWIATSDIMATLMLVFAFIALTASFQTIDKIVEHTEIIETKIYTALMKEFSSDERKVWGAEIDPETGNVTFSGAIVQFNTGSDVISPDFKKVLDKFIPRYVSTLRRFQGHIEEIDVEGHTDSDPPFGIEKKNLKLEEKKRENYNYNMNLSQRRAFSVVKYSLIKIDESLFGEYNNWFEEKLRAVGYYFSKLVCDETQNCVPGYENKERSRRVQFRIRFDNSPFYEEIRKLKKAQAPKI